MRTLSIHKFIWRCFMSYDLKTSHVSSARDSHRCDVDSTFGKALIRYIDSGETTFSKFLVRFRLKALDGGRAKENLTRDMANIKRLKGKSSNKKRTFQGKAWRKNCTLSHVV